MQSLCSFNCHGHVDHNNLSSTMAVIMSGPGGNWFTSHLLLRKSQALVRKAEPLCGETCGLVDHGITSSGDFGERLSHPYTSGIWRTCLIDFRATAGDDLKWISKPLKYVGYVWISILQWQELLRVPKWYPFIPCQLPGWRLLPGTRWYDQTVPTKVSGPPPVCHQD